MEERPWYETEEDRLYEEAVNSIKSAVENSVPFDEAAAKLDVKDEALKVPLKKVEAAKKEMLEEVEQAAIEKYRESLGQEGNA